MSPKVSERAFEDAIEAALLRHGPDAPRGRATSVRESAPAYGDDPLPGGYRKRRPEDYDRRLCMLLADVVDFLLAPSRRSRRSSGITTGRTSSRAFSATARTKAPDVLCNGAKTRAASSGRPTSGRPAA